MGCNLFGFIDEKIIECIRIARSCNDGTQAFDEWLKTAKVLQARQDEHVKVCRKCKELSVSTVASH